MLINLATRRAVLAYCLSASALLARDYSELVIQTPERMNVETAESFFIEHPDMNEMAWAPLDGGVTRFAFNIPRLGFERALGYQDGNSLFHLSSISDFGLQLHKSDTASIGFNLASNGYRMEIQNNLSEGFDAGLLVEYVGEPILGGFLSKSIAYNRTKLSTTVGYKTDAIGYIGGEVVQLSDDEGSELFSWINFSEEKSNNKKFGLGKTWFDGQYDLDNTIVAQWDSTGWTGGLLLNKVQGGAKFTAGLVDFDQHFKPTFYVDFSTPLENLGRFSSKVSLKSRKLKSKYLPHFSLKPFRRIELVRPWIKAMDFSPQN